MSKEKKKTQKSINFKEKHVRSNIRPDGNNFIWAIQSDQIDWKHEYYGFTENVLNDFATAIKPKLDNYCTMTWSEVNNRQHCHSWDASNSRISIDMRNRLIELYKNDIDKTPETLYQINLDGTHRIWGYKKDSVFYILFNDPEHKGCVVHKKNT